MQIDIIDMCARMLNIIVIDIKLKSIKKEKHILTNFI